MNCNRLCVVCGLDVLSCMQHIRGVKVIIVTEHNVDECLVIIRSPDISVPWIFLESVCAQLAQCGQMAIF